VGLLRKRNNLLIGVVTVLIAALAIGAVIFFTLYEDVPTFVAENDNYDEGEYIMGVNGGGIITPPIVTPEDMDILGVEVFTFEKHGRTSMYINPEVAFVPQVGATYLLVVEYILRGTFGITARWDVPGGEYGDTILYIASDEETTQIAHGLPVHFRAQDDAEEGSSAFLRTEFTMPENPAAIILQGDDGDGIEFLQLRIYRVGNGYDYSYEENELVVLYP